MPESQKEGTVSDQGNVEARIWRTSLPVIHFAAALAILSQAFEREVKQKLYPIEILLHPPLIEWLVQEAGRLADIIEAGDVLGRKRVPLIKIKLLSS